MNEKRLDELLPGLVSGTNDAGVPQTDWAGLHAWMMIKFGSDRTTHLDALVDRGADATTKRCVPLRYSWHRQLIVQGISLDDEIERFFQSKFPVMPRLPPENPVGYLITSFQNHLRRALQKLRARMEVGMEEFEAEADASLAVAAVRSDAGQLTDIQRREYGWWLSAVALLAANPEAAKVLACMARGYTWAEVAVLLGISEDTLLSRRRVWGLLDRKNAMAQGFEQTAIGGWMTGLGIPIDADHIGYVDAAFGILLAVALSVESLGG